MADDEEVSQEAEQALLAESIRLRIRIAQCSEKWRRRRNQWLGLMACPLFVIGLVLVILMNTASVGPGTTGCIAIFLIMVTAYVFWVGVQRVVWPTASEDQLGDDYRDYFKRYFAHSWKTLEWTPNITIIPEVPNKLEVGLATQEFTLVESSNTNDALNEYQLTGMDRKTMMMKRARFELVAIHLGPIYYARAALQVKCTATFLWRDSMTTPPYTK